tara:strand:+ start:495 stop:1022 length:528 start_codon:yes stop_codon:yes gene_type:complete
MGDIKLSLDRENILEFNVDIQGYSNTSISKPPQVRMILEQKDMGFCMVAKKEDKNYSVVIPEMKNILESGVCNARMEVIIDNKYFVPWESQIEFDKEVKVEAAPIVRNDPQANLSVKAEPIIAKEKIIEAPVPIPKKSNSVKLIVDNMPKKKKIIKKSSTKLNVENIDKLFSQLS